MTITIGKTTAPCPVCGGSGESTVPGHRHSGSLSTIGRCEACGGSGEIAQAEHTERGEEPSA